MNLSQQSSHLVLGTSTTLPVPAGIPATAAAAAAAEATEVGSSQTPLLSEKEVQVGHVGHRGWVRYKDIVSWWLAQIEMDILLETME